MMSRLVSFSSMRETETANYLRFDLESDENCCYYSSTFNFLPWLSSDVFFSFNLIICVTMKSWSEESWSQSVISFYYNIHTQFDA